MLYSRMAFACWCRAVWLWLLRVNLVHQDRTRLSSLKSSVVQSTKSALASLDRARFCWRDPPPHDRLTDADIGFAFEWLGQGEIGYGEFSQLWSGLQGFCSTEARRMFDKFDTDGSGEIDRYAPTGAALLRLMTVAWRVVSMRSKAIVRLRPPSPSAQFER